MKTFKTFCLSLGFIMVWTALPGAWAEVSGNANYTVGVEDVIEINVLRPEKLSTIVTVSPDGAIAFPYIKNVFVKGLTLGEIQERIRARLADGFIKYPEVSVALKESKSKKVFISGEVLKPGLYPFEENMTVLTAISIAGGFAKSGSYGRGKLIRTEKNGAQTTSKLLIKGLSNDPSNDAGKELEPGDTLVLVEDKFFVYGEVRSPGTYPMEENVTVLKAISMVGGFTKSGISSRVRVLRPRKTGADYEAFNVNMKEILSGDASNADMPIEPGDTIVVSEDKFHVYGAVVKPGTYPIEENTTVLKAISMVGGFTKYGSEKRVKILRPRKNKAGYDTITVNIKEVMKNPAKASDELLQPGDTLVVSESLF